MTTTIFLLEHLRVLLRAGIPISRALRSLGANVEQRRVAAVLDDLTTAVEHGVPLAERLAAHPKFLPTVAIELIRAGEASGALEDALAGAVAQLRKAYELRNRVQNALLYPAIVVGALLATGTGVMVFILPRILTLFRGGDISLPFATRVLLTISDAISAYGWAIGVALLGTAVALTLLARSDVGRPTWHRILLRAGPVGRLHREVELARCTRVLAGLLRSDVPIVRAFELTAATVGNVHYQAALREAATEVARGKTVQATLERHRLLFPPTVLQVIGIGEQTAALDQHLAELADFYEADLDQQLRNLTAIIEPVLILAIGAAVAFLAVAVLQPMYTVAQAI